MDNRLTFDVVIATRNRPEALALTIPLLLSQSRTPEKLVVIDSSDDHAPVAAAVARAVEGHDLEVIVEHSEKGLTRQRNRGLVHVTSDVVFYPDDDTLFFPGTSAAIMEIYETDPDRQISAVNPKDSPTPPPGVLDAAEYDMTDAHKWNARTVRFRTWLGRRLLAAGPRYHIGRILLERAPDMPWLKAIDGLPVEWMTGYRMTFRSEVIKAEGFEPVFGGYSLFEDTDASWAAWRHGVVAGADRGLVYHHRFPGGRANRYGLGAMGLANLAYLMAKHSADLKLTPAQTRKSRRLTHNYARLRMAAARLKSLRGDQGAGEELKGMRDSYPAIDRIFDAPRDKVAEVYLAVKSELGFD